MKKIFMTLTLLFSVFFVGINGTKANTVTLEQLSTSIKNSYLASQFSKDSTLNISYDANSFKITISEKDYSNIVLTYKVENDVISFDNTTSEDMTLNGLYDIWFYKMIYELTELYGYDPNYADFGITSPTLANDGYEGAKITKELDGGTITYLVKGALKINDNNLINTLVQKVDTATNINLYSNTSVISKDIKLNISKLAETDETYKKIKNTANSGLNNSVQNLTVYNIDLLQSNQKVQPNGNVTLTLPIPEGFNVNKMAVYRMEDSGNLTRISHKINNGKIEIETNHFSNYAIVEVNYEANMDVIECPTEDEEPTPTPEPTEEVTVENPETGMGLHYGILGLIILVGCGTYIYMKKYNKFPMR